MRSFVLLLSFFFSIQMGNGQNGLTFNDANLNWVKFDKDVPKDPDKLIALYATDLGLSENQELQLITKKRDALGIQHFKYQQLHNGIPVEGGEFLFHISDDKVWGNGKLIRGLESQEIAIINEETAFESALTYVNAEKYFWEDEQQEALIKRIKNDPNATFYPTGELMFSDKEYSQKGENFTLVWKFEIYSFGERPLEYVYVNASNGEIDHTLTGAHSESAEGTAITRYHGERSIIADSVSSNLYNLVDATRSGGIETYNLETGEDLSAGIHFEDDDNYWDNANPEHDDVATDIHWSMEMSYDYYLTQHGRDSYDDNGAPIIAYAHYGNNTQNAFWVGLYGAFGDGNGGNPLTYIDVVAHELSHGVTKTSAGLIYYKETGALNESFSDIFGQAVEFWAYPDSANWDVGILNFTFRSMSNPNEFGDPDTYLGSYWISGNEDFGGVHTNSGVQNYWFYLLSEGGSGTNDNGDDFNVEALGMDVAADITYRNLTTYLTLSSKFVDAREGSIQSAIDLYGECSNEVEQVIKAWHAVGVGANTYTKDISITRIVGPMNDCDLGEEEMVEIELMYHPSGCDQVIPSGTSMDVSFQLDENDPVTETITLSEDLNEGDLFTYTFSQSILLPEMIEEYELDVWVSYDEDAIPFNNSIIDYEIERKFEHSSNIMDFESVAHSVDSFYIKTAEFSMGKISSSAENTGNRGFMLSAKNTSGYLTPFADDPYLNFEQQPEFIASICFCVDAQEWDHVTAYFDMKQTFSKFYSENWGGDSAEYASSMRMLINGEQFGEQFHPTTFEDDPYLSYSYNLDQLAGTYFEFCFQSKNYVNPANDQIQDSPGDNTYLDNVQFVNEELVSVNEIAESDYSLYPNPSNGEFFIEFEADFKGIVELLNSLGKRVGFYSIDLVQGDRFQLDLTERERGVYFVKIYNEEGAYTDKVILQ